MAVSSSRSPRKEVTFNYTEGNAWQYSFFVPHDITRLIELEGGTEKFVAKARRAVHHRDESSPAANSPTSPA